MKASGPVVLDASAILALVLHERGRHALMGGILDRAVISTVNLAEVQSKLVRIGHPPDSAWEDALAFVSAVEPYTAAQAKIAGTLLLQTQGQGLSLGDRSCLALAMTLNAPVYTTDKIWQNVKVGVTIHIIR